MMFFPFLQWEKLTWKFILNPSVFHACCCDSSVCVQLDVGLAAQKKLRAGAEEKHRATECNLVNPMDGAWTAFQIFHL